MTDEQCIHCGRKGDRLKAVYDGRWECSFAECPHRHHLPDLPDLHGAERLDDGGFHVRPTSRD